MHNLSSVFLLKMATGPQKSLKEVSIWQDLESLLKPSRALKVSEQFGKNFVPFLAHLVH